MQDSGTFLLSPPAQPLFFLPALPTFAEEVLFKSELGTWAGLPIVAVGPKGGKIVGYTASGKPIYTGSQSAQKMASDKAKKDTAQGLITQKSVLDWLTDQLGIPAKGKQVGLHWFVTIGAAASTMLDEHFNIKPKSKSKNLAIYTLEDLAKHVGAVFTPKTATETAVFAAQAASGDLENDPFPKPSDLKFTKDLKTGQHVVKLYTDDKGKKWVFKTANPTIARAEEAASRFARMFLGKGKAGAVTHMVVEDKPGTLLQWVEGEIFNDYGHSDPPTKILQKKAGELVAHQVVDWVLSNHDAHAGNFLTTPDGAVAAIDKGQSWKFIAGDKLDPDNYQPNASSTIYRKFWKEWHKGTISDWTEADLVNSVADMVAKIEQTSPDQIKSIVAPYIQQLSNTGKDAKKIESLILKRFKNVRSDFEAFLTKQFGHTIHLPSTSEDHFETMPEAAPGTPKTVVEAKAPVDVAPAAGWPITKGKTTIHHPGEPVVPGQKWPKGYPGPGFAVQTVYKKKTYTVEFGTNADGTFKATVAFPDGKSLDFPSPNAASDAMVLFEKGLPLDTNATQKKKLKISYPAAKAWKLDKFKAELEAAHSVLEGELEEKLAPEPPPPEPDPAAEKVDSLWSLFVGEDSATPVQPAPQKVEGDWAPMGVVAGIPGMETWVAMSADWPAGTKVQWEMSNGDVRIGTKLPNGEWQLTNAMGIVTHEQVPADHPAMLSIAGAPNTFIQKLEPSEPVMPVPEQDTVSAVNWAANWDAFSTVVGAAEYGSVIEYNSVSGQKYIAVLDVETNLWVVHTNTGQEHHKAWTGELLVQIKQSAQLDSINFYTPAEVKPAKMLGALPMFVPHGHPEPAPQVDTQAAGIDVPEGASPDPGSPFPPGSTKTVKKKMGWADKKVPVKLTALPGGKFQVELSGPNGETILKEFGSLSAASDHVWAVGKGYLGADDYKQKTGKKKLPSGGGWKFWGIDPKATKAAEPPPKPPPAPGQQKPEDLDWHKLHGDGTWMYQQQLIAALEKLPTGALIKREGATTEYYVVGEGGKCTNLESPDAPIDLWTILGTPQASGKASASFQISIPTELKNTEPPTAALTGKPAVLAAISDIEKMEPGIMFTWFDGKAFDVVQSVIMPGGKIKHCVVAPTENENLDKKVWVTTAGEFKQMVDDNLAADDEKIELTVPGHSEAKAILDAPITDAENPAVQPPTAVAAVSGISHLGAAEPGKKVSLDEDTFVLTEADLDAAPIGTKFFWESEGEETQIIEKYLEGWGAHLENSQPNNFYANQDLVNVINDTVAQLGTAMSTENIEVLVPHFETMPEAKTEVQPEQLVQDPFLMSLHKKAIETMGLVAGGLTVNPEIPAQADLDALPPGTKFVNYWDEGTMEATKTIDGWVSGSGGKWTTAKAHKFLVDASNESSETVIFKTPGPTVEQSVGNHLDQLAEVATKLGGEYQVKASNKAGHTNVILKGVPTDIALELLANAATAYGVEIANKDGKPASSYYGAGAFITIPNSDFTKTVEAEAPGGSTSEAPQAEAPPPPPPPKPELTPEQKAKQELAKATAEWLKTNAPVTSARGLHVLAHLQDHTDLYGEDGKPFKLWARRTAKGKILLGSPDSNFVTMIDDLKKQGLKVKAVDTPLGTFWEVATFAAINKALPGQPANTIQGPDGQKYPQGTTFAEELVTTTKQELLENEPALHKIKDHNTDPDLAVVKVTGSGDEQVQTLKDLLGKHGIPLKSEPIKGSQNVLAYVKKSELQKIAKSAVQYSPKIPPQPMPFISAPFPTMGGNQVTGQPGLSNRADLGNLASLKLPAYGHAIRMGKPHVFKNGQVYARKVKAKDGKYYYEIQTELIDFAAQGENLPVSKAEIPSAFSFDKGQHYENGVHDESIVSADVLDTADGGSPIHEVSHKATTSNGTKVQYYGSDARIGFQKMVTIRIPEGEDVETETAAALEMLGVNATEALAEQGPDEERLQKKIAILRSMIGPNAWRKSGQQHFPATRYKDEAWIDAKLKELGVSDQTIASARFETAFNGHQAVVIEDQLAYPAKAKFAYIGMTGAGCVRQLKAGHGWLSWAARSMQGGIAVPGASSLSDMQSGGSNVCFARVGSTQSSYHWGFKCSGIKVVFHPRVFKRTDWRFYDGDTCGTVESHPDARKRLEIDTSCFSASNEICFDQGLSVRDVAGIICPTEHDRSELIKAMEKAGITEVNGLELEALIQVDAGGNRKNTADKFVGLKPGVLP